MDWHDCLMPIAPDYTMVEHAVYECAWAGCETIWVACHADMEPLIRHRLGDYIQDPVYINRFKEQYPSEHQRRIPIFYVPIHPKDRDRRDCLSWSVIYGALAALKVASKISRWTIPDKYYVSFPYGIFDPSELRGFRRKVSTPRNFFAGKISDLNTFGSYNSFTFGKEEFIAFRRKIREGTGGWKNSGDEMPSERLPIEERYSARYFELKDVFAGLEVEPEMQLEPTFFYNVGCWEDYVTYLSSPHAHAIQRPPKEIMAYREFNSIARDRKE